MMGMYPWPVPQPTPNPPTSPSVTPAPATPPKPPKTGILPCTCKASIDPGCAHHGAGGTWLTDVTERSKALTRAIRERLSGWPLPDWLRSTPSDAYGASETPPQAPIRRPDVSRLPSETPLQPGVPTMWLLEGDPPIVGPQPASDVQAEIVRRCAELRAWGWHPDTELCTKQLWQTVVDNVLDVLSDERRWT